MNFKQNNLRYVSGVVVVLTLVILGSQYTNIKNGLDYVGTGSREMVASVVRGVVGPGVLTRYFNTSGSGLASGSGSMSGSGTGSGVLNEVCYPSLNLCEIEIGTTQQLQLLYSKTQFFRPEDRNKFYTLSSKAFLRGSTLSFYFDPQNIAGESVGSYNGKYLNNNFIDNGVDCGTRDTIRASKSSFIQTPTVSRIAKWYGICAVLSAAHSLVYGFKAPLPAGFPKATTTATSTTSTSTPASTTSTTTKPLEEIWNTPYLDRITEKVPPPEKGEEERGVPKINTDIIYNEYFPVSGTVLSLRYWDEIMKLWNMLKKDCTLNIPSHAAFIKNMYERGGVRYIEVADTLNQGDVGNTNIPSKPGITRLIVTKDGCLKVDKHSPEIDKWSKGYWERVCNASCVPGFRASIRCVYPKK